MIALLDICHPLCCNPPIRPTCLPASNTRCSMSSLARRKFLQGAAAASAVFPLFTVAGTKASGKVIGANDTIRIGVAGCGGRGSSHVGEWTSQEKVQITYLIDPDKSQSARKATSVEGRQKSNPKEAQDLRQ